MLMMRLQRVGRKNDPSYRIVVTDKRTGPKSNKHVAIIGSYNPKMSHIQLDAEAAKDWLSKGVQPSDTVHNILVKQKVINAKTINPLPRKSPIVDEEALAKKVEEKVAAEEAAKVSEVSETQSASDNVEDTQSAKAEAPAEEDVPAETEESTETPVEEAKEESETQEDKTEADKETEEEKKEA